MSGALGPMATDAEHFNMLSLSGLSHTGVSMLVCFVLVGLIRLFVFIQENPSPEREQDTG